MRDLASVLAGQQQRAAGVGHERREDHRVLAVVAGERVVAVAGCPDVDVVALVADEHVAAGLRATVRAADHDVVVVPAQQGVAAEVADEQVVVVAAEEHVGVVHVLLGGHTGRLDERVGRVVVVQPDGDVLGRRAGLDHRVGARGQTGEEQYAGRDDRGAEVVTTQGGGGGGALSHGAAFRKWVVLTGSDARQRAAPCTWGRHLRSRPRPPQTG